MTILYAFVSVPNSSYIDLTVVNYMLCHHSNLQLVIVGSFNQRYIFVMFGEHLTRIQHSQQKESSYPSEGINLPRHRGKLIL